MTFWQSVLVVATVVLLAFAGMRLGWLARRRRTLALVPELPVVPVDPGPARTGAMEGVYLSTALSTAPPDRVAAHGLGSRSAATVQVFEGGVRVDRAEGPLFVAADRLRAVTADPRAAAVVAGGTDVVALEWSAPGTDTAVVTALRLRHAADREPLVAAARALVRPGTAR